MMGNPTDKCKHCGWPCADHRGFPAAIPDICRQYAADGAAPRKTIAAGTLLLVSVQRSDDYRPVCLARAVGDLDLVTLRAAYRAGMPEKDREWRYTDGREFARWLLEHGHLREVVLTELWLDTSSGEDDRDDQPEDYVEEWPIAPRSDWWKLYGPHVDDAKPGPREMYTAERL